MGVVSDECFDNGQMTLAASNGKRMKVTVLLGFERGSPLNEKSDDRIVTRMASHAERRETRRTRVDSGSILQEDFDDFLAA